MLTPTKPKHPQPPPLPYTNSRAGDNDRVGLEARVLHSGDVQQHSRLLYPLVRGDHGAGL
jgi:hypothetical protein